MLPRQSSTDPTGLDLNPMFDPRPCDRGYWMPRLRRWWQCFFSLFLQL